MRISDWSSAVCSSDLQQLGDSGVKRQLLLLPEVVELDEPAAQRLAERAGELAELGLVVEAFGPGAVVVREVPALLGERSEEHTSELQSLMRISYAVFCLKKKKNIIHTQINNRKMQDEYNIK